MIRELRAFLSGVIVGALVRDLWRELRAVLAAYVLGGDDGHGQTPDP